MTLSKNNKGFTLIELFIVVVLLGIVLGIIGGVIKFIKNPSGQQQQQHQAIFSCQNGYKFVQPTLGGPLTQVIGQDGKPETCM